jgi:iron complex transport system substrate-binding protein
MFTSNKIGVLAVFVAVVFASTSVFAAELLTQNPTPTPTPTSTPTPKPTPKPKPKVVSLDSCADQLVLHLADEAQILALSPNSKLSFSFYKSKAEQYPTHGGTAEEVISLNPDVALRTGVGDYALSRMLGRMGVATIATGLPDTIAGVKGDVAIFGQALDQNERALALIADIDARFATAKRKAKNYSHLKAMYLSPGGTTTGEGTFVGQVIAISGLTNLMNATLSSWGQIDLERLVLDPPDVIVGSFFDAQVGNSDGWRFSRHPVVETMMADALFINVPSKFLACPQWMMLDAIELIQNELKNNWKPHG